MAFNGRTLAYDLGTFSWALSILTLSTHGPLYCGCVDLICSGPTVLEELVRRNLI